ncbi:MAG: lysozyme inhibitor LprI family protein [Pseudomonadota bacterium]|nr:lysozyme inhibitor LprI family protein [Pseudomonadota bacterium]
MRAAELLQRRKLMRRVALSALALAAACAGAIDNPDAPDRVGAFERRALPYERQLGDIDGGTRAAHERARYSQFLDAELNGAYRSLLLRLEGPARAALVESQRSWLRFRDAEFRFIDQ